MVGVVPVAIGLGANLLFETHIDLPHNTRCFTIETAKIQKKSFPLHATPDFLYHAMMCRAVGTLVLVVVDTSYPTLTCRAMESIVPAALPNSADLTACKLHIPQTKFSLDTCPDDACEGNADGWGGRDGAVALTVGLIFWFLFHHREKEQNEKLA